MAEKTEQELLIEKLQKENADLKKSSKSGEKTASELAAKLKASEAQKVAVEAENEALQKANEIKPISTEQFQGTVKVFWGKEEEAELRFVTPRHRLIGPSGVTDTIVSSECIVTVFNSKADKGVIEAAYKKEFGETAPYDSKRGDEFYKLIVHSVKHYGMVMYGNLEEVE